MSVETLAILFIVATSILISLIATIIAKLDMRKRDKKLRSVYYKVSTLGYTSYVDHNSYSFEFLYYERAVQRAGPYFIGSSRSRQLTLVVI